MRPPSLYVDEDIFLIPDMVVSTPSRVVVTSCSTTRTGASGQVQEIVSAGRYLVGFSCSESKGIIAAPTMISITKRMFTVNVDKKEL
jgi:ABC-type nitrate/sulfonate/bicarbonate transport system permease component